MVNDFSHPLHSFHCRSQLDETASIHQFRRTHLLLTSSRCFLSWMTRVVTFPCSESELQANGPCHQRPPVSQVAALPPFVSLLMPLSLPYPDSPKGSSLDGPQAGIGKCIFLSSDNASFFFVNAREHWDKFTSQIYSSDLFLSLPKYLLALCARRWMCWNLVWTRRRVAS
jgi:hypothetical protein